ncbi:MAG TPA: ribonuclease HI family protein [Candidatus Omnitrophota bacterium]|nr:ribonuclease HI family protein [Candidatus Omnitrophota bacterium]
MKVKVFCDGASRNNPGDAGIGVVIKSAEGDKALKEIAGYIGQTTNNVAEYMALVRGLEEALIMGAREAEFFCDSELLVKQIKGEYKVKNEGLKPLYLHARSLIEKFKSFSIKHVYREHNAHADELSNKGIDDHFKKENPLFG